MTFEQFLQIVAVSSPIIMAIGGVFAKYKFGEMSARLTAVEDENVKLHEENVSLRRKVDELYERLIGGHEKKGKKGM